MNKQEIIQGVYDSSFNDELDKIAAEKKKSYAGLGATVGAGYGIGNTIMNRKVLMDKMRGIPGKGKYVGAAIGSAIGIGTTAGIGAGIGSLFKKKKKK